MAAMVSVRLLVCLSESRSGLSQAGSLLIAMAGGEVGAAQEQVAGRVLGISHQHQCDPGQPVVTMSKVSPELERQRREAVGSFSSSKKSGYSKQYSTALGCVCECVEEHTPITNIRF